MGTPRRCPAGRELLRWLERTGKSQIALAAELNVDRSVLWRWIAGDRTPRLENCVALERLTGIPSHRWVSIRKAA